MMCVSGGGQTRFWSPKMSVSLSPAVRSAITFLLSSVLQPVRRPGTGCGIITIDAPWPSFAATGVAPSADCGHANTHAATSTDRTTFLTDVNSGFRWKGKSDPNPAEGAKLRFDAKLLWGACYARAKDDTTCNSVG